VEQLDRVFRALHVRVVDLLARDHAAHRHGAVVHALGERDEIRRDAERLRAEPRAHAAEARDHLVEDQQDPVLGADLAQALEIALGRNDHAGGALHRLDDHRGDGRGVVQRHDALELVRQMRAPFRLTLRIGHVRRIVRMLQVIDAVQHRRREHLARRQQAADRDAAEADAVVALLAPDEARARSLSAQPVIAERDLERGVDRLGAGTGEEDSCSSRKACATRCDPARRKASGLASWNPGT
jgi:hypothetical protein